MGESLSLSSELREIDLGAADDDDVDERRPPNEK